MKVLTGLRRAALPVTALLLALPGVGAPAQAAPTPATAGHISHTDATTAGARTTAVTLITGDKVLLDAAGHVVRTTPGPGRSGTTFRGVRSGDHQYVIPSDAFRLIGRGVLDRRLFDVTGLLAASYDDARSPELPVIVTYGSAARTPLRARVRSRAGGPPGIALPSIGGELVRVRKAAGAGVWNTLTTPVQGSVERAAAPGVRHIWLDGKYRAAVDPDSGTAQIGAPAAWSAGYDGTGVKVAVLDTGIDATHPDLKGKVVAEHNFTPAPSADDFVGHGTHVASTIAGSGTASAGRHEGVAPGARLLNGKVLDDDGYGDDAGIIAGMQWAVDQGADVVNMSLGQDDTPGADPVEDALNTLSEQSGTLFVVAAGNTGPAAGTVSSPAAAAEALTVGAVDHDDVPAAFSSRGPTADGDLKPDLTAPGVDIIAAKAAHGVIGDPAGDGYVSLSGTSMATPHAAGAAALLAQQHPSWDARRLKAQLTATAVPRAGTTAFVQGTGRVDVPRALAGTLTSTPTSVGFGLQRFPHDDDQPVTRTVTYANSGDKAATVDLSLDVSGPDGAPAAPGMFSVSPARLVVPAGGTATAAVTADTRSGDVDGDFGGVLVATSADGGVTRTAVGVQREAPSYDLTLDFRDRSGAPTANATGVVYAADGTAWFASPDLDGTLTLRLPKGRTSVVSTVFASDADDGQGPMSVLLDPRVDLGHDTTLSVDARRARPVRLAAPDPAAAFVGGTLAVSDTSGPVPTTYDWDVDDFGKLFVGQAEGRLPAGQYTADYTGQWTRPASPGRTVSTYRLDWRRTGDLSGFTARPTTRDVVAVPLAVGAAGPARKATLVVTPLLPSGGWYASYLTEASLPVRGTDYFLRSGKVLWHYAVGRSVTGPDGEEQPVDTFSADPRGFTAPRPPALRFGVGVFGPSLPAGTPWPDDDRAPAVGGYRKGDELTVNVPLFDDSADHLADSSYTTARTTLTTGGTTVFRTDTPPDGAPHTVPTGAAAYRLTTDVRRDPALFPLSDRVTARWTFRSAHTDTGTPAALPLSVVRYAPALAPDSSAPAGRPYAVPYRVQRSATAGRVARIAFQVSYDAGRTWRAVPSRGGRVLLQHPRVAATVSLRVRLSDTDGNTLTQTVLDAYRTR
ncbi:Serine protease, subtilisin family [Actinacidiphila alni]|uniref:Serine protease, subtilisin family n=1 Tax=Actinacidiphila alni TaxID=380248 RepID=A0A1I2J390_9ACTN|nr:S8 family serine peptidase [Actinacidiphila alni]SFF47191.1 Serine protease, subtilisin family [Actinacidiphila alni]